MRCITSALALLTANPGCMDRILVTGASGQIGSDLVRRLRDRHEEPAKVVALDLARPSATNGVNRDAPFEEADVRDRSALERIIKTYEVDTVYHLASLLSATGERHPDRAWDVNMNGLKHVLDLSRERDLRVFWPSSIAVFGPTTPKFKAPQATVLDPDTIYGVTKRSGELLCQYYHQRFGVDVRSLRYPGLISHTTKPGGGTTDYAVDMFYAAVDDTSYTCFLRPDTRLPMMYMPDALQATLDLMDAPGDALTVRSSYNIMSFAFTPEELAAAIQKHQPAFSVRYEPDDRQDIADTWPEAVDDTPARADWDWEPEYDLDAMVADMLSHLRESIEKRKSGRAGE